MSGLLLVKQLGGGGAQGTPAEKRLCPFKGKLGQTHKITAQPAPSLTCYKAIEARDPPGAVCMGGRSGGTCLTQVGLASGMQVSSLMSKPEMGASLPLVRQLW